MKPWIAGELWRLARLILRGASFIGAYVMLAPWLAAQTPNHPPELMLLTNWIVSETRIVTFTNIASDVDAPPQTLTFSLGPGVPDGASIDPASGVFFWRPNEIQGGTTNRFEVIVADNGEPSLSATQRFQIVVRDTFPDFALSIGSTNLLLNETGGVRILFSTRIPVTNVSFILEIAGERLAEVRFSSLIGGDAVVQFSATGENEYACSIGAPSPDPLQGTVELGMLSFSVVEQSDSAIVPLLIAGLTGIRSDGVPVGRTAANPGRVFVVINEPLLEIDPFAAWHIRLYRLPGKTATVQYADTGVNAWQWFKLADFVARPFKTVDDINDPSFSDGRVYQATIPRLP